MNQAEFLPGSPHGETFCPSLVNSHLDYANALYMGFPQKDLQLLQRTQNQAVILASGIGWAFLVSTARRELHWLPIKNLCLTFKAWVGLGPLNLHERIKSYNPPEHLDQPQPTFLSRPRSGLYPQGSAVSPGKEPTFGMPSRRSSDQSLSSGDSEKP